MFGLVGPLTVNLIAFLYPSYQSFKAIQEAKEKTESTTPATRKWLCYWTTIALVSQVEFITSWLPFYYPLKLLGVLYLILPQTNGVELVYERYVEPLLAQHEKTIDDGIERLQKAGAAKATELSARVMDGLKETAKMGLAADAAAPAAAEGKENKKDE